MIYLRNLIIILLISAVPSIISYLIMSQFTQYIIWLFTCIISTLIFFIGSNYYIYRFFNNTKNIFTYYKIWLVIFVIYIAGGILCLSQNWMYPFTWIYFHTRIIQIITMPINEVTTWSSFIISMIAFFILIISQPIVYNLTQKNNMYNEMNKTILNQTTYEEQLQNNHTPMVKCPYCNSYDTTKISTTSKVINILMFGIFGQKRKYQWHCNNCKSNF